MSREHAQRCRRMLEDQLEQLANLRNASPRDPSFKLWRQNTLTVLQRIWPGEPARSDRFRRIPFSPSTARMDGKTLRDWFGRGCGETSEYLRTLIDEIDVVGVPAAGTAAGADARTGVASGSDEVPVLDLPAMPERATSASAESEGADIDLPPSPLVGEAPTAAVPGAPPRLEVKLTRVTASAALPPTSGPPRLPENARAGAHPPVHASEPPPVTPNIPVLPPSRTEARPAPEPPAPPAAEAPPEPAPPTLTPLPRSDSKGAPLAIEHGITSVPPDAPVPEDHVGRPVGAKPTQVDVPAPAEATALPARKSTRAPRARKSAARPRLKHLLGLHELERDVAAPAPALPTAEPAASPPPRARLAPPAPSPAEPAASAPPTADVAPPAPEVPARSAPATERVERVEPAPAERTQRVQPSAPQVPPAAAPSASPAAEVVAPAPSPVEPVASAPPTAAVAPPAAALPAPPTADVAPPAPSPGEPAVSASPPAGAAPPAAGEAAYDTETLARATQDFLRNSPVLGLQGRPVQRAGEPSRYLEPDAVALESLAAELGRLGVPTGQRAALRAHLVAVADQLEGGAPRWDELRATVAAAMAYRDLARRLVPILLPWLDRAA